MQRRKGATALVWQGAHGQRGFSARTLQDRRHIEARNGGGQHPGVSRGRLTGGAQELDASRAQLKGRGHHGVGAVVGVLGRGALLLGVALEHLQRGHET